MAAEFSSEFHLPTWARTLIAEIPCDDLVERVVEADMHAAFEHLRGNEEFGAQLAASVRQNLHALTEVAVGRIDLGDVELPEPRLLAILQARLGVPQTLLQLSYRVGFLTIWRGWVSRLETAPVPMAERAAALRTVTELIFAYQNAALGQVAAEHVLTETALHQSREHVRHELIRNLLNTSERPIDADLVTLGYDLDKEHMAVAIDLVALRATELISRIRAQCQVWDTLTFSGGDNCSVWWFGRHSWTERAQQQLLEELRAAGVPAEVAEHGQGLDGFREGYRQLLQTRAVRAACTQTSEIERAYGVAPVALPKVLCFIDLRIEALLLGEREMSAAFVARELGPLAAANRSAAVLRETLLRWLETRSHVATAEQLGLHEHTVRNRLRRIEELLGHPISVRPTELVLALRLRRLVGGPTAAEPGLHASAAVGEDEARLKYRAVGGD